jgi:cyclophilin family peptidyl-prolyl cis-trans isomerase
MKWWLLIAGLTAGLGNLGRVPTVFAGGAGAAPSNTVVRIEVDRGTNRLGSVDVELFDHDKPETVRNFLLYARSGAYSNMFLHRAVPGFVIQGGGFSVTNPLSSATFSSFLEVTNYGRLTNEFAVGPRLTNSYGTIAMAKVGNDPNSASSQWFFNLNDNAANLDNQNGGFTVFGRVLSTGTNSTDGTNVLNHFNTLATSAGVINLSGFPAFNELPVSYTNSTRTPAYRELYFARVFVLGETNVPGATPPTIAISQPEANARFTNQTVIVSGTATDDRGVARVLYRHQGGAAEIASGTNDWQIALQPRPGFNTVSVESVDWDGHRSSNATVNFFYVAQLALRLQTNGVGKIAGVTNGQLLQVGSAYTATATPGKGYFFEGWTGAVTSSASTLSFQVGTNATNFNLTAQFTRDFFPVLAGAYQGLIRETNNSTAPGLENTGFMTLSLNKKGGFSGRIRHRSGAYSFSGRFDRNGSTFLQGTVGGISRTITLRLNTTNQHGLIVGSVSGSASSTVEAALDRVAPALPASAPPIGTYPFSIAPPTATPGPLIPGGFGYGRATITRSGVLKLQGTLGDGTPFAGTARASRSGRWPFYLNMARGQSAVQGWIAAPTNAVDTLESRLSWMRAFDIKASTYRAGFSNQVTLAGSRLLPPASGRRYLNWVTGVARIDGANLVLGVTNTVRLNADNTIEVSAPNPSSLDLDVDLQTGLVSGSFLHPWLGTVNPLHGVLFKPGESIRGQFRDGDQVGSLIINVAPFLATQMLANVTLEGLVAAIDEGGLIRFEADADITLTEPITLPYSTAFDANGHSVRLRGGEMTSLFVVGTNQLFSATGIVFADGRQIGTNGLDGLDGAPPQGGQDVCGGAVMNLGGQLGFTNCVFTNFVVQGGNAGVEVGTNGFLAAGGRAWGAAICNRGGRLAILNCSFLDNMAIAGNGGAWPATNRLIELPGSAMGGAIFSDGPEFLLHGSSFSRSETRGGQPAALLDGTLSRAGMVAGGAVAAMAGTLRTASNHFEANLAAAASLLTNSTGAGVAYGGALFVESNVVAVIERSVFSYNRALAGDAPVSTHVADAMGGAIYSGGSLLVTESTVRHNLARGGGGVPAGAARGGGLAALGIVAVTNSTFHHNLAEGGAWFGSGVAQPGGPAWGGGIYVVRSNLSVLNSTFAFNEVLSGPEVDGSLPNGSLPGDRLGAAIAAVSNSTTLASLTIAFNRAGSAAIGATNAGLAGGGGIQNLGGAVAVRTSILVSNAPANYRGSITDVGYNFSSDASIALTPSTGVSHTNIQLFLGPLVDNGGPTWTMALNVGSPARDKVPTNNLPAFVDQRGIARPQPAGGFGDAGAVEAFLTNAAPIFVPPFPLSATVRAGTNYTLQATAVATNPISYLWRKDGAPVAGATNASLTLFNIQPTNAGSYVLIATNTSGAATSAVATITVDATPLIFTQPTNLVVSPTANTSFFVGASPTSGMSFYWYRDGVRVGPNAATLPITNAAPADRGSYFVVISNAYGIATSQVATLTFNSLALQIVTQPSSVTVTEGQNINFNVVVTGFPAITYQWYFANAPLPGQTTNLLSLTNITTAHVGTYHVVITNGYLALTSAPAILALSPAASPQITLQPTNLAARAGSNVTFSAFASGTSPLTYWWFQNGSALGAPGPSLVLTNVQATNAGAYQVIVTNLFGMATSLVATLTVDSTPRILAEPLDVVVSPGSTTNFLVEGDGPDLVFAWQQNGLPVPAATNAFLTITNAGPADRGVYQVILSNAFGTAVSRLAAFSFNSNALAIVTQPTNTVVTNGQFTEITVVATGIPPLVYQWSHRGGSLLEETNSVLVLLNADPTNSGPYQVVITNDYLSVTSVIAMLTVETNTLGPASITEPRLSLRLQAGSLVFECRGRPSQNLRLLQAASMEPAVSGPPLESSWIPIASGVVPSSGTIQWVVPLPPGRQFFYRAVSP